MNQHGQWKLFSSQMVSQVSLVLLMLGLLVSTVSAQEQTSRPQERSPSSASSESLASTGASSSSNRPRAATHSHSAHQSERRSKAAPNKSASASLSNSPSAFGADSERVEPLAPELMDIAAQIYTGRLQCELGQVVVLLPVQDMPGRFQLTLKKQKYLMTPALTPTGAVKLEDQKLGAFWIQLGNKSMLFNSKLGQRMADDCQGAGQQAVAMRERISPPPSLFEPIPRVDH